MTLDVFSNTPSRLSQQKSPEMMMNCSLALMMTIYLLPDRCTTFKSISLLSQSVHSKLPISVLYLLFPPGVFPNRTRRSRRAR